MKTLYLTAEEILFLHHVIIEDFGGSQGVRDENRLLSVVGAPRQQVFSKELYETVHEKAAVLLRNIIGDHPFVDGNKRTAITVCGVFLARNNYILACKPKELEDFAVQIATDHLTVKQIANWLKEHSKKA